MTMARHHLVRLPSLTPRPITSTSRIASFSSSAVDNSRAPAQAHGPKKAAAAAETNSLSPQWLSELRTRVGRCITFGISEAQAGEAGSILQEVARDWRSLVAGREGYLTSGSGEGGGDSAGLFRHGVVWGEQVRWLLFVFLCLIWVQIVVELSLCLLFFRFASHRWEVKVICRNTHWLNLFYEECWVKHCLYTRSFYSGHRTSVCVLCSLRGSIESTRLTNMQVFHSIWK